MYLSTSRYLHEWLPVQPRRNEGLRRQLRQPELKVYFDTGNIMEYEFPEHWISILGQCIRNVHLKEWDRRSGGFGLPAFRTLLDGTTNWPAVMQQELNRIDYQGYLTFEHSIDFYALSGGSHLPDFGRAGLDHGSKKPWSSSLQRP